MRKQIRSVAALPLALAAALLLMPCAAVHAQSIEIEVLDLSDPPVEPLSPDDAEALRDALSLDALDTGALPPARAKTKPPAAPDLNWKRTDRLDGSAAVSVRRPLPTEWDSSVGADFGLAAPPVVPKAAPGRDQSAAWASVKVPGLVSVDARVEPGEDQSKLGTTLSRSLPVGGGNSITLQNSYAVTGAFAAAQPQAPNAQPSASVWSTDRMVKFNIGATGTTLAAGTTSNTADNVTRNKLSAEQKLFDAFNVTTTVTDVGKPAPAKSISAGFKLTW